MTLEGAKPYPGSDAAIAQGCQCPAGMNADLRRMADAGQEGVTFWTTKRCPLHREEYNDVQTTQP